MFKHIKCVTNAEKKLDHLLIKNIGVAFLRASVLIQLLTFNPHPRFLTTHKYRPLSVVLHAATSFTQTEGQGRQINSTWPVFATVGIIHSNASSETNIAVYLVAIVILGVQWEKDKVSSFSQRHN